MSEVVLAKPSSLFLALSLPAPSGPSGDKPTIRPTSPSLPTASSLTPHTHVSSSSSLSSLSGDQTPTPSPYSAISGMLSPTLEIDNKFISRLVLSEQSVRTTRASILANIPADKRASWAQRPDVNLSNFFKLSLFLSPEELACASATCRSWKTFLDTPAVWKQQQKTQGYAPKKGLPDYKAVFKQPIPNAIFPSHYTTLFGVKVVNPIPRPPNMRLENNKPDPDKPGRKVEETHIWTYNPILEINGKVTRLTTDKLAKLAQNPQLKFPATIGYKNIKDTPMGDAGWLLIRREIFEDTAGLQWDKQVEIVKAKGYEIPYGPDVLLTGLVWRVLTGKYLFEQDFTATRALGSENEGMWIGICDDLHGFSALRCARTGISDISTGFVGVRRFS